MSVCTICKVKVAQRPFYFPLTNQPLYSYEELCYYIYYHPSFFSKEFMNEEFKEWLLKEVGGKELVERLYALERERASERIFLLELVTAYNYLPTSSVQVLLKEYDLIQSKDSWMKKKYFADDLFRVGCYDKAQKLYEELLDEIPLLPENYKWVGQVYYGIGSCFARNMEYEQSAIFYSKSFFYTKEKQCKYCYWSILYLMGKVKEIKEDIQGDPVLMEYYTDFIETMEDKTEGLLIESIYDTIEKEGQSQRDSEAESRNYLVSKWKRNYRKKKMYQYQLR